MNERDFLYWLKGFLLGAKELSSEEVRLISAKLEIVLHKCEQNKSSGESKTILTD